jgi:hypothetical protein
MNKISAEHLARDALMSAFKGQGAIFRPPTRVVQGSNEVVQGRRRACWTSVDML